MPRIDFPARGVDRFHRRLFPLAGLPDHAQLSVQDQALAFFRTRDMKDDRNGRSGIRRAVKAEIEQVPLALLEAVAVGFALLLQRLPAPGIQGAARGAKRDLPNPIFESDWGCGFTESDTLELDALENRTRVPGGAQLIPEFDDSIFILFGEHLLCPDGLIPAALPLLEGQDGIQGGGIDRFLLARGGGR